MAGVTMRGRRLARIVIVGASLAGARAAEAIRRNGFEGQVILVGKEAYFPPYDRPPLSKQVLSGAWGPEEARLRVARDLQLELRLCRSAEHLDLGRGVVYLDDSEVSYDGLVVATGASPRCLPMGLGQKAGIHYLRTMDDCLGLRKSIRVGTSVAIVGAGFIGCEVAAACRTLGLDVSLIDALEEPMSQALGSRVGGVLGDLHRREGVRLYMDREVRGFAGNACARGVWLDGGEIVEADVVVIAIGVVPETRWLEGSGLELCDGVVCDQAGFAEGAENVVAAGDVARWRHGLLGQAIRVEHWSSAAAQGQAAGRNLLSLLGGRGAGEAYSVLPYFWSRQYGWNLQFVGMAGETVSIESGAIDRGEFVAVYRSSGAMVGALCVNRPSEVPLYRKRVRQGWASGGWLARG